MESLSAKLNKLKTAWDNVTMSIMDSEILKVGIDALTGLITLVNNLTGSLGKFSGGAKIAILVGGLMLADKALTVFIASLKKPGTTAF
jgi:hypothetical protein